MTWQDYLFVINLDRRQDKWEYWRKNATKHNMITTDGEPFGQRWPGTDGIKIGDLYTIPLYINYLRLSQGEIGAFTSHARIWKHVVDTGIPYAVVFEDDVQFVDGFIEKWTHDFEWIQENLPDWDIIYMGGRQTDSVSDGYLESELQKPNQYYNFQPTEYTTIPRDQGEAPIIFCNKLVFMGAFSYCISRKFAQELITHLSSSTQLKSVDLMIRIYQCDYNKRAYFCNPLLTYSDSEMGGDIKHIEKPNPK